MHSFETKLKTEHRIASPPSLVLFRYLGAQALYSARPYTTDPHHLTWTHSPLQLGLQHFVRRNQLIIRRLRQRIARSRTMMSCTADVHHIWSQVLDICCADQAHAHLHFVFKQFWFVPISRCSSCNIVRKRRVLTHRSINARLPIRAHREQKRPPNAHGRSA